MNLFRSFNRAWLALPLAALLVLPACREATSPAPVLSAAEIVEINAGVIGDARRVLDLEGGVNFRDLGGYRTADGRAVKWEMVYRSGSPAGLTEADMQELARRGIRSVCDFRASEERTAEPSPFAAAAGQPGAQLAYFTRDYELAVGDLASVLGGGGDLTPERTRAAMIGFYREIAYQQAENFKQMFALLAEGKAPLVFNCSAGKDRTGVGAALLLTALGVPRETVLADYALSDQLVDYRSQISDAAAENPSYAALAQMPWEVIQPLMASDPAYLAAALTHLEERHGSVDSFIEQELGVTPAMRERLRELLTQPV